MWSSEQMQDFDLADVLDESREYIEEHGWFRGEFRDVDGEGVCSIGAVLYSQEILESMCMDDPRVIGVAQALSQVLGLDFTNDDPRTSVSRITVWNDLGERKKDDVLDAFAKAAKIARAGFDPDA